MIRRTKKHTAELKRELKAIRACSGDCKNCPDIYYHFADSTHVIYWSVSCNRAPALTGYVCTSISHMKEDIIAALLWELEGMG